MDHLPSVLHTSLSQPEIPYLRHERFEYDSQGLTGFPARKKFDIMAGGATAQWVRSSFLQSWLFFGTMVELFMVYNVQVDMDDFTRITDAGRTVVTTERLQGYIATWIWKEAEQNKYCLRLPDELFGHGKDFKLMQPGVVIRYSKILAVLQTVYSTLSDLDSRGVQVTRVIWDSIIILGTTLRNAARIIFRCYKLMLEGVRFDQLAFKTVSTQFEKGRWCPAQREIITEFLSLEPCSLFFCSQLDRTADAHLHEKCTARQCIAFQIDEKEYHTQHTPDCMEHVCPLLGPDQKLVSRILLEKSLLSRKMGSTTVFYYSAGKLTPMHIKLGSSTRFVAISHVWADGLGNPHANKLPKCQITRIQNMVNELFDTKYWPVPFWIDTFCVPLDDAARKVAIGRMQWVYSTATNILVLDKGLERISTVGMSPEEVSVHIMCSNWSRRLWTLQEGATQKNVRWRFADSVETFEDLKAKILKHGSIENSLLMLGGKSAIIYKPYKVLNETTYGPEATNALWPQIMDFFQGIKIAKGILRSHTASLSCIRSIMIRDCSRPGDESLCFSAITNNKSFPPSVLVNMPVEERYKALFRSESQHPIGILFLNQKRYEEYGFRWIPKTLFQHNSPTQSLISHVPDPYLGGTDMGWYGLLAKKERGFEVHLPGFELNQKLPNDNFQINLLQGDNVSLNYSAFIHEAGFNEPLTKSLEGNLAILTPVAIWSAPSTCVGAVVTILEKSKNSNTRFEALIDLSSFDGSSSGPTVKATFDDSLTTDKSKNLGAKFLARTWFVG